MLSLALLSGCTATPITLPYDELGLGLDAGAVDAPKSIQDSLSYPDSGTLPPGDALPKGDAGAADAAHDGVCLECPLPDGMLDGSAGDAEAGPAADALIDILVGE